jgi:hypothetical protein
MSAGVAFVVAGLLFSGATSLGQFFESATTVGDYLLGTYSRPTERYARTAIIGSPYSCDFITDIFQTDGTHLEITVRLYRDSQGRTREERHLSFGPTVVEIRDNVASFAYLLDTAAKIAHRMKLQLPPGFTASQLVTRVNAGPAPEGAGTRSSTTVADNGTEFKSESLGTQTIQGFVAEGTRLTETYPAGARNCGTRGNSAGSRLCLGEAIPKREKPSLGLPMSTETSQTPSCSSRPRITLSLTKLAQA